jgi:hypothetical protein
MVFRVGQDVMANKNIPIVVGNQNPDIKPRIQIPD